MNTSKCGKLIQMTMGYQWIFSKLADLLSVLSLIPWSSTFQGGDWVKFPTLGTFRMSNSLPTCASLSLISVGCSPNPILGQTIDRCIRKRLENERSRRENTRRSWVFLPEFCSRFLSALQQNKTEYSLERLLYLFYDKEAVKFLTHYFLLKFQTKLLAQGVTALAPC